MTNWIKGGSMGFKHETPLRGWIEIYPTIKPMLDADEEPCRGWKEIRSRLRVQDDRTAQSLLKECGLLRYENKRPVLYHSEYKAVRMLISSGVLRIVDGSPELFFSDMLSRKSNK